MKKLIWTAALSALVAAVPAQASTHRHGKVHHHAGASAGAPHPDHVTIDGKDYKVCTGAIADDCVNPRQAGLGFGNQPIDTYRPHDDKPQ